MYVRFLLTHLPDPAGAVANVAARLVPGGVLIVEDIDFRGHFCDPDVPSFWRMVDWYRPRVVPARVRPEHRAAAPRLVAAPASPTSICHVIRPAG